MLSGCTVNLTIDVSVAVNDSGTPACGYIGCMNGRLMMTDTLVNAILVAARPVLVRLGVTGLEVAKELLYLARLHDLRRTLKSFPALSKIKSLDGEKKIKMLESFNWHVINQRKHYKAQLSVYVVTVSVDLVEDTATPAPP